MQATFGRKVIKLLGIFLGIVVTGFLIFSASVLSPAFSSHYPFHAQCKLKWTWSKNNCSVIHDSLVNQVKKWAGPKNCESGGEKCLYKLVRDVDNILQLDHTTPVHKYIDSITFSFCDSCVEKQDSRLKRSLDMVKSSATTCEVAGFSVSTVWYAVLDYGTNYCNMRNLANGAGLTSFPDFKEETDDNICTQFSTADCNVY